MEAGNSSGSMQSSSGGDEEYDSRAESNVAGFLYDPSPILGDALSQPPSNAVLNSSFLNLDAFRPGGLRSDLGNNLLAGPSSSSSSAPSSSSHSIIAAAHRGSSQGPLSSAQLPSVDDNGARSSQPSDQAHHGLAPRNPKKRTRASRRAPTTVLATDTSNFRAMVQEFTGIPAPPFSGSPYSRRLDLFGPGSGLRSGHLEPLGSIRPLRPSARRVHQQSPFTTPNNNNTISLTASFSVTTTSSSNPSSFDYHLPSDLGGLPNKQSQDMVNMQNQMWSFQSLLQPQPLHSSFNMPSGLGAKSTTSLPLPSPSFEELGMSHGDVNASLSGLPSHMTTAEGNIMRLRNDNMWRDHGSEQDQHLRPFDGNYI